MSCAPIDTEAPRFYVITVEGYRISPGGETKSTEKPALSATVFDRFYMREMRTLRSTDRQPPQPPKRRVSTGEACPDCGGPKHRHGRRCRSCAARAGVFSTGKGTLGYSGALAAAAECCAELNAWHEREGWEQA